MSDQVNSLDGTTPQERRRTYWINRKKYYKNLNIMINRNQVVRHRHPNCIPDPALKSEQEGQSTGEMEIGVKSQPSPKDIAHREENAPNLLSQELADTLKL